MLKLKCTFRPQAWVNDNAVPIDTMAGRTYDWIVYWPDEEPPEPGTYDSDELRQDPNAPEWVREWDGPYEVDYQVFLYQDFLDQDAQEREERVDVEYSVTISVHEDEPAPTCEDLVRAIYQGTSADSEAAIHVTSEGSAL